MKAKGKSQKAKGKRSALFETVPRAVASVRGNRKQSSDQTRSLRLAVLYPASKSHFCLLIFAFCLLLSPGRAQERINLNTASAEQLMRLPYVGNTVAQRILEHRRKHGDFKRPQDVIVIKGLSAKRYRQIAHLIRI